MHDPTAPTNAFDSSIDLPPTVDEAAVRRMRFVTRLLDESVRVPGTEFDVGLDPLLSALPGNVGDAVGAGLSLYIVLESARLGVSYTTLLRMLANITVDVAVGSVPIVGVLFDAVWKANVRNLELALEELAEVGDDDPDAEAVTIEVE
ncbi:DUF4112 domain-containing protein [Salinigranum sp. GCM10025319]|uniref:DUF4112 domain-containing protein n=1 Tax=Salinigranum sp. GCM10025319 TaxID=3252687 RepID=UPI0036100A05